MQFRVFGLRVYIGFGVQGVGLKGLGLGALNFRVWGFGGLGVPLPARERGGLGVWEGLKGLGS